MGAGKPDEGYGVREFKAKFGGTLVEHGRFLCVLNKSQYRIGEGFVKIMRSNKSIKSKTKNASKSNLTVVSDISKINQNEWTNFVANHPHGNIFQTPALYNIYTQTPKHEPYILMAYEQGKIVGCLLSVVQNQYKGILGILSSRIIVSGGPLVDNNNEKIASELIETHKKNVENKGVVIQYRNFFNMLPLNEVFRSKSFIFESHLNILIDLSKGTEKLWQELHEGRKKKVKSAINAGLTVDVSNSSITVEQIQNGYNIIKKVYESAELPLANIDLLINASKNDCLLLFELKYNNVIIGVRFVLKFKNDLYGWYAGSLSKYYSYFPNDLLIWETLKWGAENGYKLFDYGGAGNPNVDYGVRKFKLQSGGEIVNYGRYELVHKPFAYFIARTGFEFWRLFNRNR
jgi:lipid II:glycine glycyltransferase (peptidoglycan interpeptide bridge formation enzyme)